MKTQEKRAKQEEKEIPSVEYDSEEQLYRDRIIKNLTRSSNQRNKEHTQFNDMDFNEWYEKNSKAANSYIPPKRNKADTRIVTGTTQEKEITLLSSILNFNLEPNIEAYDKNDLAIAELGENMEDLVRKSREMEDYDSKRVLIYKELLDQGSVFVEELWVEEYRMDKEHKFNWDEGVKLSKMKWNEKVKQVDAGCRVNLYPGTKVYLGDMKEYHMNKQPFIFTVETAPYVNAEAVYRNWERWDNVPRKVVKTDPTSEEWTAYRDWTLEETENDMVEIIKYQDKWNNEYMIMLNGVMMLPPGFPLTAISPSGEYSIAKGIAEPISEFFPYGRSVPAKTKADQEVLDEMLKLIVLKTQQSFMPPLANRSKKVLSKRMFWPGVITPDVDPNTISPIVDSKGVTSAEFQAFELIKRLVDEKTVSPTFAGAETSDRRTATEILEIKKQQMMKLGLLISGVITLERHLAWLRVQNILAHWTKSMDTDIDAIKGGVIDVYKTVTINTTLENGQRGNKVIEFNPELAQNLSSKQVRAEEDFLSEPGKPVRKVYINPKVLKTLRAVWKIVINPTEKDSSELDRVLFVQNIKDSAEIFGIQSLNLEYLKERFAILAKEDPAKWFISGVQAESPLAMEEQNGGKRAGGKVGSAIAEGIQKPSLNELLKTPSGAGAR